MPPHVGHGELRGERHQIVRMGTVVIGGQRGELHPRGLLHTVLHPSESEIRHGA